MADLSPTAQVTLLLAANAKLLQKQAEKAYKVLQGRLRTERNGINEATVQGVDMEWRMYRDRKVNEDLLRQELGEDTFNEMFTETVVTVNISPARMDKLIKSGKLSPELRAKAETYTSGSRRLYLTDNRDIDADDLPRVLGLVLKNTQE